MDSVIERQVICYFLSCQLFIDHRIEEIPYIFSFRQSPADKSRTDEMILEADDYDNISYPLRELGWRLKECINPVMYTLKDWMKYSFSPFYHNVTNEGIILL